MQSGTVDFAPGAATWRTGRNLRVVSVSGLDYYENVTSSTKTEVHNVLHCGQRGTRGFLDIRADRQTNIYSHDDRITEVNIIYLEILSAYLTIIAYNKIKHTVVDSCHGFNA